MRLTELSVLTGFTTLDISSVGFSIPLSSDIFVCSVSMFCGISTCPSLCFLDPSGLSMSLLSSDLYSFKNPCGAAFPDSRPSIFSLQQMYECLSVPSNGTLRRSTGKQTYLWCETDVASQSNSNVLLCDMPLFFCSLATVSKVLLADRTCSLLWPSPLSILSLSDCFPDTNWKYQLRNYNLRM